MKIVRTILAALALSVPAIAFAAGEVIVHRDPGCGCCTKWAAQIRQQLGRSLRIIDDAERRALQKRVGVPADLASCHTAVIDGLAFEGHVPAADIKRLLTQRPKGVQGLAVAGMPLGSPGMEVPAMRAQAYDVVAFGTGGRRVYAHHRP